MRETCQELLEESGHTEHSLQKRFNRASAFNHCAHYDCCNPDSEFGGEFPCRVPHEKAEGDPCLDVLYADKHYGICCKDEGDNPLHREVCRQFQQPATRHLLGYRRPHNVDPNASPEFKMFPSQTPDTKAN